MSPFRMESRVLPYHDDADWGFKISHKKFLEEFVFNFFLLKILLC